MFDLSDCEDVSLRGNETTGAKLLRAERTKRIQAENNRAGRDSNESSNDTFEGALKNVAKWIGSVLTALLVAYIVYRFGWN